MTGVVGFKARQSGVAIVMLLWMISAMALTVSTVVHFSQGDLKMVQLRRHQAESYWLGRGLAKVAMHEQVASGRGGRADGAESDVEEQNGDQNVLYQQSYAALDGIVEVKVFGAGGFLSLNTAAENELAALFEGLGGLDAARSEQIAAAIIEKRQSRSPVSFSAMEKPSFQYVEELLTVPGMTRLAYDRVKSWVHPFAAGSFTAGAAPQRLRSLFPDQDAGDTGSQSGGFVPTFDNIQRSAAAGAGESVVIINEFTRDNGDRFTQVLHGDLRRMQLRRVGEVQRGGWGEQAQ